MLFNGSKKGFMTRPINFIIGVLVLAAGVLPLLQTFGIISFLPQTPAIIFHVVLSVAGIALLLDGMMGVM